MEWSLEVNEMLRDEITKITNSLLPPGFEGDVRSVRLMQESLSRVVDRLGEQSAAAQGLSKVITTAEKLRTADSHTLYLFKDAAARDGKGEVLGMLKVGRKHLFLFDAKEAVREVEPLCVLDFFVLQDHQRRGVGRALFDHMLQDMGTTAHRLAVDGPSDNMVGFLRKNYGVTSLLRQNNNFAVSPHFFEQLSANVNRAGAGEGAGAGAGGAVGRFTAHKPHSSIGNVIHGGVPFDADGEESPSSAVPAPAPAAAHAHRSPSRPRTLPVPPACAPPPADRTPAGAPSRRDSQLTDKGFFDVKFHHKKLW